MLGVSRQAIYQQEKRDKDRAKVLEPVVEQVKVWRRLLPKVGTRKLHHLLRDDLEYWGIKLGRDRLFDLLRQNRLLIQPRRQYRKTTHSKHWMRKSPNLYQSLEVTEPEQAFVSDITYLESAEGVHYLSLVTDAGSRKIMGYHLSDDMKAESVSRALIEAISNRITTKPLIHHSDRGLQYCSAHYREILEDNNIASSMTDGYDCYQNALAERVNGILKNEFLTHKYQTRKDLEIVLRESVHAYNTLRPHLSLGMKTPEEVHKKAS